MADAVSTTTMHDSSFRRVIKIDNLCDGTGESAVIKVDKSADTDGGVPTKYAIDKILWNIQGFTSVILAFDATTDDKAFTFGPGEGSWDLSDTDGVVDPVSTGATGDIVLTTAGDTLGDTYNIVLYIRKIK